jgi:DNA primase large subunit
MQPESQTDHIALLALMICGTLVKRLDELGQLDDATARRLHHLVKAVRTHANARDLTDLEILFDNIDLAAGEKVQNGEPA